MDLKEYIGKVKDLEISLYQQNRLKIDMEQAIKEFKNPYLNRELDYRDSESGTDEILPAAVGCLIPGAVIGLLVGIMFLDNAMGGLILGAILGMAIGTGTIVISNEHHYSEISQINSEIAVQNAQIRKHNEEIISMSPKKQKILQSELYNINQNISETKKVLDKYYSKGIIFEKYHSLVPVCMFYEYLCSGRCDSLEGHEGAYNIYENELRMNVIIGKLDDIINSLDEIKQNQYIIAQAINNTNTHLTKIENSIGRCIGKLESLESNAELSTYYNEISAINTTYLALAESLEK